jgi:hypothetical protein
MKEIFFDESGDSNFGTVYIVLIFAIAALLLILIVKPLFQNSMKTIPKANNG